MHSGRWLMFLGVVIMAGCSPGANDTESVTGQAMYRERIAAPPGARLEVSLEDASTDVASERLITRIVVANAGQPPFAFEVPFKRSDIDPAHRYALSARLLDRERLLFETAEPVPVITDGQPLEVELLLRRAGSALEAEAEALATQAPATGPLDRLPATFTGTLPCADCPGIDYHVDFLEDGTFYLRTLYRDREGGPFDDIGRWAWSSDASVLILLGGREAPLRFEPDGADGIRLLDSDGRTIESDLDYTLTRADAFDPIEPELRMRGMYRYLADAAVFMECRTSRRMPVAMEADNAALERAYLDAVDEPGRDLLAVITGRIVERVPMDGDTPSPAVVPVEFHAVRPGETCGTPLATTDLVGTYWKLTRLGDDAVVPIADSREPHLILDDEGRVAGSDGCNRLMGSYRVEGPELGFSQMASTMMACPQGMQQADRFRGTLEQVERYRVVGSHLELFGDEERLLARFEAVYLD
jgi:copper homeostasis protein (lipoprotein)